MAIIPVSKHAKNVIDLDAPVKDNITKGFSYHQALEQNSPISKSESMRDKLAFSTNIRAVNSLNLPDTPKKNKEKISHVQRLEKPNAKDKKHNDLQVR